MKTIRIYTFLMCLIAVSCGKVETPPHNEGYDKDLIQFFMRDVQYASPSSKAIIESTETLKNKKLPLRVVNSSNVQPPFNGAVEIGFDEGSGLWNTGQTWNTNQSYSFYSFLISQPERSATVSWTTDQKPADKVTITEPSEYSHNDDVWADFLMSYVVPVNGADKPLVEFEMERITAGVEVFVSTPLDEGLVTIKDISITNISNSATFSLVQHDMANSGRTGIRNNWVPSSVSGSCEYSRSNIPVMNRTDEDMFDNKFLVMRFVTIPQAVTSILTINYSSDGKDYSVSFDLYADTSVIRWDRGRKTRYYVNIDTSVGLEAKIAEWISVDFIEGTFLPWQPGDDQ